MAFSMANETHNSKMVYMTKLISFIKNYFVDAISGTLLIN